MECLFRILLLVIGLISAKFIYSNPINRYQAEHVAKNIYFERINLEVQNTSFSKIESKLIYFPTDSAFFIFNILVVNNPQGFVIVSGNDDAYPVLGYSLDKICDMNNLPPACLSWLNLYHQQIKYIRSENLKADQNISGLWERYKSDFFKPYRGTSYQSTLLTTKWGQGNYYNSRLPFNTPVGCIALAMGEVMKYYRYPKKGQGSHTYKCGGLWLSANFENTTYQWEFMPDSLSQYCSTQEIDAVAILLWQCGVSVETAYNSNGSGAYLDKVPDAMKNYFRYCSAKWMEKHQDISVWNNILVSEIDKRRPVIYAGRVSDNSEGHAFVLDGYQFVINNYQFHFDWGWDGQFNGYFYLNNLNPGTNNFTSDQRAILNINPNRIALTNDINIVSNPVCQYAPLTISAKIINYATENYIGKFDVVILDSNNKIIEYIDSTLQKTLVQDYNFNLSFHSKHIMSNPGIYKIALRYQDSLGNMLTIDDCLYENPILFEVLKGYPSNTLSLDSLITIIPNPVYTNEGFTVSVKLVNFDSINDISGDIAAGFIDAKYGFIELIDSPRTNIKIESFQHLNSPLVFHCSPFKKDNESYKFGIFYRKNEEEDWALIKEGLYSNPIFLQVINNSGIANDNKAICTIFPNPSVGDVMINLSNYCINQYKINIFDITGRNIPFCNNVIEKVSKESIKILNLQKGMYIIEIQCKEVSIKKRVIVY